MHGLDGSSITGCCGRTGKGWQRTNGSPVRSLGQLQIGLCWTTRHTAFSPQTPRQGSLHFWLIQANDWEHSALDYKQMKCHQCPLKTTMILRGIIFKKTYRALWSTAWRYTHESRLTGTDGLVANFSAGAVWSTGRWHAGSVCYNGLDRSAFDRNRSAS